jgi:hypothetical protein
LDSKENIATFDARWGVNPENYGRSYFNIRSLGTVDHPDRLALLISVTNGHKGRLFKGEYPVSLLIFAGLAAGDEQGITIREVGFFFHLHKSEFHLGSILRHV